MKKRILSAVLATAMLLSTTPVSIAESAVESNLLTNVNQDITTSAGVSLLDDTYQYCVENDEYFAYMWVPEEAEYLNGVMVAKSNFIEARLMQSKTVRDVLAKYNMGLVYIHTRNTTEEPSINTVRVKQVRDMRLVMLQ